MAESWRAYDNIINLVDANGRLMNYTHHQINHQLYFVDPTNPIIHTQTVERLWGDLKDVVRRIKKYGTTHLPLHISGKIPRKTLHHLMI